MSPSTSRRIRAARLACLTIAAPTALLLATTPATAQVPASAAAPAVTPALAEPDGEDAGALLQAVEVDMTADGTLTDVAGTVVESSEDPSEADSDETDYSPADVAGDLPVRVVPMWRTAEGAGSDLSDLEGYDGRIRIDLTVQNLTVRPETVQYDVEGQSREQAALVGAPLSVVASADLADLEPTRVVTAGGNTRQQVTNGVVSQGAPEGTQVQWASILAPPQLGSSAHFTLVLDADDFQVPDIDLSVQPGLVTDPSMAALVDSAFSPESSDQMELQARTIELIGDVNAVLARASSTISDVRSTLDSSAETLGSRTLSDLQASTASVASSMRTLDGALGSLDRELSATLSTTGSSAVSELQQAVSTVDRMLGDTRRGAGTAQVLGNGCNLKVARTRSGGSLYDSLVTVASQLNGFAGATDRCRSALQDTIRATIGPEQPNADVCRDNDSVTCSLYGAQGTFDDIAGELLELTDTAVGLLQPVLYADAVEAATELGEAVDRAQGITALISAGGPDLLREARQARNALQAGGSVSRLIDNLASGIEGIRNQASTIRAELVSMRAQSAAAAQELCAVVGDGATPNTLTAEQVEGIRAYLVGTACDGATPLGRPSAEFSQPLTTRLGAQVTALDGIISAADTSSATTGVGQSLATLRSSLTGIATQLSAAIDPPRDPEDDPRTLDQLLSALVQEFSDVRVERDRLIQAVDQLDQMKDEVQQEITEAIENAADRARDEISGSIDPEIRKVTQAGDAAGAELGEMFSRSASGLRDMATDVVAEGRRSVQGQKGRFEELQREAATRVSRQVEEGLARISSGVAASSRDMKGATALLTADLRRVLLDLGQRRVNGGGLLGAMTTGAAAAGTADYQLALATNRSSSYANVRGRDVSGLLLRQAQTDAAMQVLAQLPAFQLELPPGTAHRTVYTYRLDGDR
jgi:hypothetical protein